MAVPQLPTRQKGFTLIELLIVVAIIAILAAIAVPNFLEAQTRSKVTRSLADMRSIRTGIESYYVDNNRYPETDTGQENPTLPGVGLIRITTPIAYLTSVPRSPFQEDKFGDPGQPQNAKKFIHVLYVRALAYNGQAFSLSDGTYEPYRLDRHRYLFQSNPSISPLTDSRTAQGGWGMKSVGPDNRDDYQALGASARLYDPTNGTVSAGDVYVWGDRPTALAP